MCRYSTKSESHYTKPSGTAQPLLTNTIPSFGRKNYASQLQGLTIFGPPKTPTAWNGPENQAPFLTHSINL